MKQVGKMLDHKIFIIQLGRFFFQKKKSKSSTCCFFFRRIYNGDRQEKKISLFIVSSMLKKKNKKKSCNLFQGYITIKLEEIFKSFSSFQKIRGCKNHGVFFFFYFMSCRPLQAKRNKLRNK